MIDALPLLLGPEGYQISRSVRLRSSASAFFSRTPASASNRKTWTWSAWAKLGDFNDKAFFRASAGGTGALEGYIRYTSREFGYTDGTIGGSFAAHVSSSAVLRDPSAWYHLMVVADTTNATASQRIQLYINGSRVTALSVATYPSQNYDTAVNNNVSTFIGTRGTAEYYDGYLTEINFIDGQALTPSSFGETNPVTGVWQPRKYNGTYGTNGFYLNFSDNSAATAAAIGKDYSGNGNNWTPNNISVTAGNTYDSMLDVPTPWPDGGNGRGNYCTLNPLDNSQNAATGTLSNGNLTRTDSTATNTATFGTMFVSSGQWYYEVLVQAISSTTANCFAALSTNNKAVFVALRPDGSVLGCTKSGSGTYTTNDVLGIAVDIAANTVYVYKNGALLYTLTPTTALTDFTPSIADGTSATGAVTASFNFGQQPFSYTPPSGFRALNTQNLPTPTILKGNQYFDVTTYTGNGTSQSIVNSGGMQPDLVVAKNRSAVGDHVYVDAVRGATKRLFSNLTDAESTSATSITAFNSNGFSVGVDASVNGNGNSLVGWQWKEGATQGFDIVTYTGTGANRTVAHSLGVAPRMMIVKGRNFASSGWIVWHSALLGTEYLSLEATNAKATAATVWNSTVPDSSVFSLGTNTQVNQNTSTFVAYLFAEVAGFSRFGSYTGNGSADGTFVFTGFRPRYIMLKRTDTAGTFWIVHDTARSPSNAAPQRLFPNASDAEGSTSAGDIDILSNGFKLRNTDTGYNANGGTYIFAAFAETSFKFSLGR